VIYTHSSTNIIKHNQDLKSMSAGLGYLLRNAAKISTVSVGTVAVASFGMSHDTIITTNKTADCESKPKLQRRVGAVTVI